MNLRPIFVVLEKVIIRFFKNPEYFEFNDFIAK